VTVVQDVLRPRAPQTHFKVPSRTIHAYLKLLNKFKTLVKAEQKSGKSKINLPLDLHPHEARSHESAARRKLPARQEHESH
jgi:hypothetical protein